MVRILIVENAPSLNKGEMAILEGMIESFSDLGEVEVSMLSAFPDIDSFRYGKRIKIIDSRKCWPFSDRLDGRSKILAFLVMLQHIFFVICYKFLGLNVLRFYKGMIWQEYLNSDAIIAGHDNSFGIGGDPETPLFYPLYIPLIGKVLGKPVVFYAGTIPSLPRRFRYFIGKAFKFALNNMDLITLRENISYQKLKDMRLQNNQVSVTADLAALLKPVLPERIKEIMSKEGINEIHMPFIGMTISRNRGSMAFPELNNPELSYQKHIKIIAQVVDNLINKLNALVIFVPHCIGFGENLDDRIVAADILQICQNKDKVKVITNEYGPAELKGLIGQFDLFIGERLHSVIAAMTMYVPSVAISYSSDERLGMIKMFGQEEVILHVENLDSETLLSKINNIWLKRDKIRKKLKLQAKIMKKHAMVNGKLLKELLDNKNFMKK